MQIRTSSQLAATANPVFSRPIRGALITACVLSLALVTTGCGKKSTADKPVASKGASQAAMSPTLGADRPKVDVLAFVDYECPFCRSNAGKLTAAAERHGKTMRVRIVNLPLDVHSNSVDLAKAGVAAHKQGKWAPFYKAILADEKADKEAAIAWAAKAGLDAKKFAADLDSKETSDTIAADVALAAVLGVTGTPSFIINGALVQGAQNDEDWDKIVTNQSAAWDALVKKGTKEADAHWTLVQANSPQRAPVYKKHVLDGEKAPASPVPAKVAKTPKSGVVSAKIMPAGGGMGGVQVGQPVRIGEEAGDPKTVWRVAVRPDDPQLGEASALVTMVLFEDFECPFCKQLQGAIKSVREKVGKDLRVVYKHNPLPFHKNASAAAEAAEAARAQGKFWELHDILFANQDKLTAGLRALAEQAKLDMSQYDNAMSAHGARGRIAADMEQAAALGARGTPNIFINGRKLVGAKDAETLLKHVNSALEEAKATVAKGTVKADAYYDHAIGKGKLLDSLASETVEIATDGAPARGPKGAAIHVVVFGDFQCPFTARLDPHIAVMEKEFPGRIKVSWLDFPLFDIHPNADAAAQVGQEANAQGKFWEFYAVTMADQSDLSKDGLIALAKKAGMNVKKLDKVMKVGKHTAAVAKARAEGVRLKVKGTPTVYINGHKFTPQLGFSATTFRSAITRLLGTRS